MHWLLALVHQALFEKSPKRSRDVGLVPEIHREVGRTPRSEHAEALEFIGHDANEAFRVGTARPPDVRDRHLARFGPEFAVDAVLDRETMAVVSRNVGRIKAGHRARLHDKVLQDLVERGAKMNLPVGVRRTVVEHELRRATPPGANLAVQIHAFPARDRLGFGLLEVGLHREPGPR